jgi:hypothetical protein
MIQLNKFEKIITVFIICLLIFAIIISIKSYYYAKNLTKFAHLNGYITENFPSDFKTQSKKFKFFEDLFNSNDKIITYSIETNTLNRKDNQVFDKIFKEKFNKSNLNYKIITYNDIEKIKKEYQKEHFKSSLETPSCGYSNETEKEFDEFTKNIENCLDKVCLIDNKNNTYTTITREPDYILEVLNKLN